MLDPKRLGLAAGILWGLGLFIITVVGIYFNYGEAFFEMIKSVYPGYSVTWVGAFIGAVYGFFDGFIGLYIFGWLYNKLN